MFSLRDISIASWNVLKIYKDANKCQSSGLRKMHIYIRFQEAITFKDLTFSSFILEGKYIFLIW